MKARVSYEGESMKKVFVDRYGAPDVLTVRDVAMPEPRRDEVRIRVGASGVNFADLLMRAGVYPQCPKPPFSPGYEIAGTVDAVGRDATGVEVGRRVFASVATGGYAEFVTLKASTLWPTPAAWSDGAACTLPVNGLTAWMAIRRLGNTQPKEVVVIDSAGGGVGLAALQFVRSAGARAIGLASRAKHDRLLAMGCSLCLDPAHDEVDIAIREFTQGVGADVFLDASGGAASTRGYNCLAPLGRLVCCGTSGVLADDRAEVQAGSQYRRWEGAKRFAPYDLMMSNRSVSGIHLASLWSRPQVCIEGLLEVLKLVEAGHLMPIVDRAFVLDDAEKAHHYIHERRNFGKVVLEPVAKSGLGATSN
jgi:NADPH:quinone reductase-like Zn-dependent oxidoreductase